MSYEARHKHRFGGGCRGRLIVTNDRFAYESIDKIEDSRQWDLADIKELKLRNPYSMEIKPFAGAEYEMELQRSMDTGEFNVLVDRVTKARVAR